MKEIAVKLQCTKDKDVDPDEIDDLNKQLIQTKAKFDFIGFHTEGSQVERYGP